MDTDLRGRVFHINEFIESGFRAYVNSFTSRPRRSSGLNFLIIAGNTEKGDIQTFYIYIYIHEIGARRFIKPSRAKLGGETFVEKVPLEATS